MPYKNKSSYKNLHNRKKRFYHLQPGYSGFLCTCNSKQREKDCIREAYNILNEFADKLFGSENVEKKLDEQLETEENKGSPDIDDLLKEEIKSIKSELNKKPEVRRFQAIESGANGIVFIKTTVPDPVNLAWNIVTSLSHVQKSKTLLRLLPVEITCKAYLEDICKACDSLFDKYFSGEEKTFAVVFNHRNNDRLKRDIVIDKVAELVSQKNEKNKADLKNPQLTILIEVIQSNCCISVVPDFYSLKKYNLMELVAQNNDNKLTKLNELENCETDLKKS